MNDRDIQLLKNVVREARVVCESGDNQETRDLERALDQLDRYSSERVQ